MLRFTKRLRFGPFTFNFGGGLIPRYTSTTTRLGRASRNSRRRGWRFDVPGPWNWRS